jgi:hypothetical protein
MISLRAAFGRSFGRPLQIVRLALREIFDESAYARFLERRQLATSPQAYADFLRENEVNRGRRPRCC